MSKKQGVQQPAKTKVKKGKKEPRGQSMADRVGEIGSSLFGAPGKWIGRGLGGALSGLIGSGDYKVESNTLTSSGVPYFSTKKRSVRIRNREYLGDLIGSTAFSLTRFQITPSSHATFPWLSGVAANFQQFKFHGLVFEFVTTSANALNSTNTALGTVIMATNYDTNKPLFANKVQMEDTEYSCTGPPSQSMMHPIECASKTAPLEELYIWGSEASGEETDERFYVYGNFQIATVGMQASANIGEIWVSYDVELIKPILSSPSSAANSFYASRTGVTNSLPFGTGYAVSYGITNETFTGTSLVLDPSLSVGYLLCQVVWFGSSATVAPPSVTITNGTLINYYKGGTVTSVNVPATPLANTGLTISFVFRVDGPNCKVNFDTGGTLPASVSSCDVILVPAPYSYLEEPIVPVSLAERQTWIFEDEKEREFDVVQQYLPTERRVPRRMR